MLSHIWTVNQINVPVFQTTIMSLGDLDWGQGVQTIPGKKEVAVDFLKDSGMDPLVPYCYSMRYVRPLTTKR